MKNLTINAGDYARSYDGYIARCKRFYSYDNFIHFDKDIIDTCCEPTNYFDKKDIKKYIKVVSSNIIDLIEVGDYVNGEEVNFADVIETWGNEKYCWTETGSISSGQIYSIVTKEQFESMEYKIEK